MASRTARRKSFAGRTRAQRPTGTRLTDEQKQLILAAIEAGATDHVAAQAAGISARTFRELRQRAEGRHPTRRSTPELRAFFAAVDETVAKARLRREIEVAKADPKHWLKYRARSKPGLEGWTEPVPDEADTVDAPPMLSSEELAEVVGTLISARAVPVPPCADPGCLCAFHRLSPAAGGEDDDR